MTVKGRAVISSTRNASIRLEKSVKNLLTRRLTANNDQDTVDGENKKKAEERCVSMPACNDIFSSISFYSPLHSNLKSMRNEEDLSEARHSPPPPVYPPPPLPDESIYDELQSVTSGGSSRYDTLSSTVSDRLRDDTDVFALLNISAKSDSDQSLNLSDPADVVKRLSRSDSWTFYDIPEKAVPVLEEAKDRIETGSKDRIENGSKDRIDNESKESSEPEVLKPISPAISVLSVRNSLYENWTPKAIDDARSSKSVLFEFDPFAKSEENTYGNYENNDLMLLEALLATSEPASSDGSLADLQENDNESDEQENEVGCVQGPAVPRRYDSLPKNEYDEVEMVEVPQVPEKVGKNPALLPKLANLARRKQPAVPPRKPQVQVPDTSGTSEPLKSPTDKKTSVMQKLKKLHDSTVHVKPNVMNFMKSKKLLRKKDGEMKRIEGQRMKRPIITDQVIPVCHRGIVYRSGVGMERARDLVMRAAVLSDQKINFYTDKGMTTVKETLALDSIQSVHLLQDVK